jgi:protein TonB
VTVSADKTNPEFKGGQKALKKFLSKNLEYPEVAANYSVEGSVIMTFVVGVDGSLSNISAHDCKIERFNTTKFSQEAESRQKELKKQFALLFAKRVPASFARCRNGLQEHSTEKLCA